MHLLIFSICLVMPIKVLQLLSHLARHMSAMQAHEIRNLLRELIIRLLYSLFSPVSMPGRMSVP